MRSQFYCISCHDLTFNLLNLIAFYNLCLQDNWDDDDEDPNSQQSGTSSGPKVEKKNKKRLAGKIAEKEVSQKLACLE